MSLKCLAILGNRNEPLYLCDNSSTVEEEKKEEDYFGFFDTDWQKGRGNSSINIRHELMIHACLDRLEEILGSKRNLVARWQRGSHWMGIVSPMEGGDVYGYVTASNIKILAMIQKDGIISLKKTQETDIKLLFAKIHEGYVKYTMNPFTKIRSKIEPPCKDFERDVQAAIDTYNETVADDKTTAAM